MQLRRRSRPKEGTAKARPAKARPAPEAPVQEAPVQEAPAQQAPAQQAQAATPPQGMTASEWAQLGNVPNPLAVPAKMTYSRYDGKLSPTSQAALERVLASRQQN